MLKMLALQNIARVMLECCSPHSNRIGADAKENIIAVTFLKEQCYARGAHANDCVWGQLMPV